MGKHLFRSLSLTEEHRIKYFLIRVRLWQTKSTGIIPTRGAATDRIKKKVRGKHSIPRPVSHELPLALETHIHTFARPSARGWRLPDEGLNETTVRHVLVSPASSTTTTTTITKPIHLPETGITGESYDAMGAHAHQRTQ